jgi:predicted nucleic acid-binding protein
MALIVLDASVVIAHLDPADALHARASAALREYAAEIPRMPASAYAETLVVPARRGALETARDQVARLGIEIVAVDTEMAEVAARLRGRRRRLRLPDALVLACAEVLDADAVLTADARWRRLPRVRVV